MRSRNQGYSLLIKILILVADGSTSLMRVTNPCHFPREGGSYIRMDMDWSRHITELLA